MMYVVAVFAVAAVVAIEFVTMLPRGRKNVAKGDMSEDGYGDVYVGNKHFYLVSFVIVRNEELTIKEWIDHNRNQGVEHIFLIDHGPSTDTTLRVLQPYIEAGFVTRWVWHDRAPGAQERAYIHFFPEVRAASEWMILCDADEYMCVAQAISRIPWQ